MPVSILGLARARDLSSENHEVRIVSISDLDLHKEVIAKIIVTKLSHDIFSAHVTGDVELNVDCHRCLSKTVHTVHLDFTIMYSDLPTEDEWPIKEDNTIDLEEPIRQEVLFSLPIQQLCKATCQGI